jgi:hypothetical protein
MSAKQVARAIADLREAAAEAAWTQWSAISTVAASRRAARSIVDPEALSLVSMALRDHEPRLWSAVVTWAQSGARLLSVQRAKNLVRLFPAPVRERLAEFAVLAMREGGDRRWRSFGGSPRPTAAPLAQSRPKKGVPLLAGGAALMLRLRLGLGVGIKPDVLAYLIGNAGRPSPVVPIARATGYQGRAVRRALEELAAAGFIESRPRTPVAYRVDNAKWAGLLEFEPQQPPPWHEWAVLYALAAALDEWSRDLPQSELVLASEARDLVGAHLRAFDGVPGVPTLDKYRGGAYIAPFAQAIEACAAFMAQAV